MFSFYHSISKYILNSRERALDMVLNLSLSSSMLGFLLNHRFILPIYTQKLFQRVVRDEIKLHIKLQTLNQCWLYYLVFDMNYVSPGIHNWHLFSDIGDI